MAQQSSSEHGPITVADRIAVLRELHDLRVLVAELREDELASARRLDDACARIEATLKRVRGERRERREFSVRMRPER